MDCEIISSIKVNNHRNRSPSKTQQGQTNRASLCKSAKENSNVITYADVASWESDLLLIIEYRENANLAELEVLFWNAVNQFTENKIIKLKIGSRGLMRLMVVRKVTFRAKKLYLPYRFTASYNWILCRRVTQSRHILSPISYDYVLCMTATSTDFELIRHRCCIILCVTLHTLLSLVLSIFGKRYFLSRLFYAKCEPSHAN